MIICFNSTVSAKKTLDDMLASEEFKDYSEIINCAIENFAVLQHRYSEKGVIFVDKGAFLEKAPTNEKGESENTIAPTHNTGASTTGSPLVVPETFRLNFDINRKPDFAEPPIYNFKNEERISLTKWIFGQYNKLLPLKVVCRALARLQSRQKDGIILKEASSLISDEAAKLGDVLYKYDFDNKLKYDNTMKPAFPLTSGSNWQKSRIRFANLFVGSSNKKGDVGGFPIEMRLINQTRDKNPKVLLTEKGWEFALLYNPILDEDKIKAEKLTQKEIEFLINYISESVPQECFAYKAILKGISKSKNTPERMDKYLEKNFYSPDSEKKLTSAYLSTQRSGAISRMVDLKLVRRIRNGVKVKYEKMENSKYFEKINSK